MDNDEKFLEALSKLSSKHGYHLVSMFGQLELVPNKGFEGHYSITEHYGIQWHVFSQEKQS